MKIVNLIVNNFKGIKAVEITPQDDIVIVSGKNGAGKSSVLDSIWYALQYKQASKQIPEAIKNGETGSEIKIDLGDYVVRRFDKGNSYLEITGKDGSIIKSPQAFLDSLIGKISFDPLEFVRMKDDDRLDLLLNIGGVKDQIDKLKIEAERVYNDRTIIGRERDNYQSQAKMFDDLSFSNIPNEEISISDLIKKLTDIENNNKNSEELLSNKKILENKSISLDLEILELENKLKNLKSEKEKNVENIKTLDIQIKDSNYQDTTDIKEQIQDAGIINNKVKQKKEYNELVIKYRNKSEEYDSKTCRLEEIKKEKRNLLDKIDLGIGKEIDLRDGGKLYIGDIPFEQLCFTERLKISLVIAMKNDNQIRVIRVMDGGLIDEDNMKVIKDFATKYDYQIWIEKVDDSGMLGFTIEDGELKK